MPDPEERILICNAQIFDHHEKVPPDDKNFPDQYKKIYRPCGNLMRISVESEGVTNRITCLDIDPSRKTGVYISRRWVSRFGYGQYRYTYGPRRTTYFSFLHCSACNQRYHWKRFVKADI